jgi:glucose/arabinose dehydrogenase
MQMFRMRVAAAALSILVHGIGTPDTVHALMDEPGFRAVPVAHSAYPISALAVAPDGRMFAAVQSLEQPEDPDDPGTAEIRVFTDYQDGDGAVFDEGTVWATVTNLFTRNIDEGLLGIALAPDFATSKLVYVYVTTHDNDDEENQNVRVYRETAGGVGELLGTVATGLEPPLGSSSRNGGGLTFGADGCLYVGVGDNGSNNSWNAQVLLGSDPIQFDERTDFCNDVCLGPDEYPNRQDDNNLPNHAGKVLRMDVEGPSDAQPGWGNPIDDELYAFAGGLGNPTAMGVHPMTGQLYVAERGENSEAELNIVDSASNHGWPCLQGTGTGNTSASSCLGASTVGDVYSNHPQWRRPIASHTGNPVITGPTAYTGRGYPSQFFGDVFYLLRDSARIYRLDLAPPCFMPDPSGIAPLPFHDSDDDNDFRAYYDSDDDGDFENVSFFNLIDLAQGPDPLDRDVLYVTGRRNNSNSLDADSVIFRIEYATAFTPYTGAVDRVPDSCYASGPYSGSPLGSVPYRYENPFHLPTCLPPGGPCPGLADGTSCDDRDPCNGADACSAGICRHSAAAPDGSACVVPRSCRGPGQCLAGACLSGPAAPNGTPCPDNIPCNGLETCLAGECQAASGPGTLKVTKMTVKHGKPGKGSVTLMGTVNPILPVAPSSTQALGVDIDSGGAAAYTGRLDQPSADVLWKSKKKGRRFTYKDKSGSDDGITNAGLRTQKGGTVKVNIKSKRLSMPRLTSKSSTPRIIVGDECFEANLSQCKVGKTKLSCKN